MIEHFESASLRQHQIEQHEFGRLGVKESDRFLAVGGSDGFVVFVAKVDLQPLPQSRFILNDENLRHATLLRMIVLLVSRASDGACLDIAEAREDTG